MVAGHEVVAFVHSPAKLDNSDPLFENLIVVQGDVMKAESVKNAAVGCSAAVNCTSPAGGLSTLEIAKAVVTNAASSGVDKFYMVGGLGASWAPGTNKTVLVQDWDDSEAMAKFGMPAHGPPKAVIQGMTKGHLASMAFLKETGLPHTHLCPGQMVDGAATADKGCGVGRAN